MVYADDYTVENQLSSCFLERQALRHCLSSCVEKKSFNVSLCVRVYLLVLLFDFLTEFSSWCGMCFQGENLSGSTALTTAMPR